MSSESIVYTFGTPHNFYQCIPVYVLWQFIFANCCMTVHIWQLFYNSIFGNYFITVYLAIVLWQCIFDKRFMTLFIIIYYDSNGCKRCDGSIGLPRNTAFIKVIRKDSICNIYLPNSCSASSADNALYLWIGWKLYLKEKSGKFITYRGFKCQ